MQTLLVGTYTLNTFSEGIYSLKTDTLNFEVSKSQFITAQNPSFLAYNESNKVLYTVEELGDGPGRIKAFKINPDTLESQLISDSSTEGSAPCHIAISQDQDRLIVCNYMSGELITFALNMDGSIAGKLSTYKFEGNSVHPTRQKQSHIHSSFFSPDGSKVFVQDLGTDSVYQFKAEDIFKNNKTYTIHNTLPGAGPRHLAFSKTHKVYLLTELDGCIEVMDLDEHYTIKRVLQRISLNAQDQGVGLNMGAQIRLSSDERYLYASNRGEYNHIAVYEVKADGTLVQIQVIGSEGKGPRHFEFSINEDYLYAANQYTDTVQQFSRNKTTGLLSYSGEQFSVPSPVFIGKI